MQTYPLLPADMEALMRLARQMHTEGIYSPYPLHEDRTKFVLLDLINNPDILSAGVAIGGQIVGAIFAEVHEDVWTEVRVASDIAFFVDRAYRGSKAGLTLMLEFERWAYNCAGAQLLRPSVHVGIDNAKAGAFLRNMGYTPAGEIFMKEAG